MLEGHFIESARGRIFVTGWKNNQQADTAILCLPPIIEELNCSRRAISVQCEELVGKGIDCFVLDYFGTGDSEGDFEEASLTVWEQDVCAAVDWIKAAGYKQLLVWGLRFGATLATRVIQKFPALPIAGLLLWQPIDSGARLLASLSRMQAVKDADASEDATNSEGMDVAGYLLSQTLVDELQQIDLSGAEAVFGEIHSVGIGVVIKAGLSQALRTRIPRVDDWCEVVTTPFWSIPEAPVNEELRQVTTERLLALASGKLAQAESA